MARLARGRESRVFESPLASRAALVARGRSGPDTCDLRSVSEMERDELLEHYEAFGHEGDYLAAKPL